MEDLVRQGQVLMHNQKVEELAEVRQQLMDQELIMVVQGEAGAEREQEEVQFMAEEAEGEEQELQEGQEPRVFHNLAVMVERGEKVE